MSTLAPLLIVSLAASAAQTGAAVDTLKGPQHIEDCVIYSWAGCNAEVFGEDCRRYNAGAVTSLPIGSVALGRERRALLRLPGWNGIIPDSSQLVLYRYAQADHLDRRLFLYPVTRRFFEGTEVAYNLGDYPDPDSGATWNHAWLDVGDGDSSGWSVPGGDYDTTTACTMLVTDTNQYSICRTFNRILHYWDSTGDAFGVILVNENQFPANSSSKTFGAAEGDTLGTPRVILFYPDSSIRRRRREIIVGRINN